MSEKKLESTKMRELEELEKRCKEAQLEAMRGICQAVETFDVKKATLCDIAALESAIGSCAMFCRGMVEGRREVEDQKELISAVMRLEASLHDKLKDKEPLQ